MNAGATDCSAGVAPDTTYTAYSEPGGGGYTSLLLTGYANVPGDAGTVPPYDAGPPATFEDDAGAAIDAGPQPMSGALTTLATSVVVIEDEAFVTPQASGLRLVHLAATHPEPITMQVSTGPIVIVSDASADDVPLGVLPRPEASEAWVLANVPYGGFSTRPGPTDPFGYETMASGSLGITIEANNWTYTMSTFQTSMFAFDGAGGARAPRVQRLLRGFGTAGPALRGRLLRGRLDLRGGGATDDVGNRCAHAASRAIAPEPARALTEGSPERGHWVARPVMTLGPAPGLAYALRMRGVRLLSGFALAGFVWACTGGPGTPICRRASTSLPG